MFDHSRGRVPQVAEMHALESLASPSSVEKEKAQLAMMKAALKESLGKVRGVRAYGGMEVCSPPKGAVDI